MIFRNRRARKTTRAAEWCAPSGEARRCAGISMRISEMYVKSDARPRRRDDGGDNSAGATAETTERMRENQWERRTEKPLSRGPDPRRPSFPRFVRSTPLNIYATLGILSYIEIWWSVRTYIFFWIASSWTQLKISLWPSKVDSTNLPHPSLPPFGSTCPPSSRFSPRFVSIRHSSSL